MYLDRLYLNNKAHAQAILNRFRTVLERYDRGYTNIFCVNDGDECRTCILSARNNISGSTSCVHMGCSSYSVFTDVPMTEVICYQNYIIQYLERKIMEFNLTEEVIDL